MSIWRRVQGCGKKQRDGVEVERRRIFEQGGDEYPQDYVPWKDAPFFVEIDGTMVSSREGRSEQPAGITNRKTQSALEKHVWILNSNE